MSNSTKFKVVGISNNIAKLQRVGGGFYAYADDAQFIGAVGDVVDVLEKDYTPEGDLSGYQAMSNRYDGTKERATAVKVSEVHGGWDHGFKVDVTWSTGERQRVSLDRDELVKTDGTYDDDYVSRAVEAAAPEIE